MALQEILLRLPAEGLDAWTDALIERGACSVCIEDEDSDTPDEIPCYGEPGMEPAPAAWTHNRVSVLLDADADPDALLREAAASLAAQPPAVLERRPVADADWVRQTQAQFSPFAVGRLWVVPSWHEAPAAAEIVLRIDPGVAFGTGTHPTTRLCLAWMDAHLAPGSEVLDYGSGSGILSIAALLLGARGALGVDIDPQAVMTARDNARHNGVSAQYTSSDELAGDPGRQFDLVVANILANPILLLAPSLAHRVRPGGHLLLSGILERQADEVIARFAALTPGVALKVAGRDDGWIALAGTAGAA